MVDVSDKLLLMNDYKNVILMLLLQCMLHFSVQGSLTLSDATSELGPWKIVLAGIIEL